VPAPPIAADPLARFSPAVRDWFRASFEAPTDAQTHGWEAIASGRHTLIHAPTGSGKTLAAFLWCLDRLATDPRPAPTRERPGSVRVLYVSPLKALTYDIERNLRAPLTGIGLAAARLGETPPQISVASRTGDTPSEDRREIARHPPDILITTPESLYLMLTSAAREVLRGVEHVIVDRGPRDRRLEARRAPGVEPRAPRGTSPRPDVRPPAIQRIGLSATQRPLETIARFLGGSGPVARSRSSTPGRASRSSSRSSSPSTTWPRSARCCRRRSSPAAQRAGATCGRASGRRSTRGSSS
jgi:ATP-dependent Lhr-like helicase